MKILLLGSHMNYNLEHYVYMNLLRLGHEVEFYGYREKLGRLANLIRMTITRSKDVRNLASLLWLNKLNEEIKNLTEKLLPELVLTIKGEAVKPEIVKWMSRELGVKTTLWYPDDPRLFNSLVKHVAPCYDYFFTASQKAIEMYEQIGVERVYHLPFACEPTVHKKARLGEEEGALYGSDICFVGTYTLRRGKIIGALRKAGLKVKVWGPYWKNFVHGDGINDGIYGPEMVKAFNVAKIVLNVHVDDDIPYKVNMRTFEATGSGAFLLTDKAYGIEKMFSVGRELITFGNEGELVELAKYYLSAEEERRRISARGQERAYEEHVYEDRIKQILEKMRV